jgi:hypothetical protein
MHVFCTHCGIRISADDLNIDTGLARCRACHAVFSFTEALAQHPPAPSAPHARGDLLAAPPPGVRVEDLGGLLRITRRWFHPVMFFLLFFVIAWDGFLVFWYSMAFTLDDAPWIMVVFPIAHLAVGIGLTYFVVCGFVNSTTIAVGQGLLTIRHGPLPWPGNPTLNASDLDQLYCKRSVSYSRNGHATTTYALHALDKLGRRHKLVANLREEDEAIYLEQRLESFLRIADRPVRGEYRG